MLHASAPAEGTGEARQSAPTQRHRRAVRWLAWVGGSLLLIFVIGGTIAAYVIHNAEPILRKRVIASLQDRFHSPVELDALHISLLRGLAVSGSGLRILYLAGPSVPDAAPNGAPPMLSVKNFEFHTGFRQLFEPTMRVVTVYVQGMQLNIPPKQERGPLIPKSDPTRRGQPRMSVVIDKIVCSDMTLTIETNKPGKSPLIFNISDVTMLDVGAKKPLSFDAVLVNPKPAGQIHSTGHFGPWQDDQPRDTPIDGDFSFTHADLGTTKGVTGTLSSTGKYGGTLGEIGVSGTTDTPDFSLDVSDHPVDLKADFDATVDGTSGDTKLNSVHARLLHTVLDVTGMVIRASNMPGEAKNVPGHFIDISVVSDQARVEDLLTLGVKTNPALMLGAMRLRARLRIPPGQVSISQKMRIQGTFAIRGATFSNPKWQQTVDKLSERARGNPEQANAQDAKLVKSEMGGSFTLADAVLDVSKLNYQMPGAQVDVAGKYSLDGKTFNFGGTVRTQATASQMLTGWKSLLAMPFDPLLKKNGAGVEVPVKIDGTQSDPKFGVDLGKLGAQIFNRRKNNGQRSSGTSASE